MDLTKLPEHVLINIFRFLEYPDILTCREVCKDWQYLLSSRTQRGKTYFSRAHHICFRDCTLSLTRPPLSVFRNSSSNDPFFRFLTVKNVTFDRPAFDVSREERVAWYSEWKALWQKFGTFITHLTVSSMRVLMEISPDNGSLWRVLTHLEVKGDGPDPNKNFELVENFELIENFKIPSVTNVECGLLNDSYSIAEIFRPMFPNVTQISIEDFPHGLCEWSRDKLVKIKCEPMQLQHVNYSSVKHLTISKLETLDEGIEVENFVANQNQIMTLSIQRQNIIPVPSWHYLTDLEMFLPNFEAKYLRVFLEPLRNLKSFKAVGLANIPCFFGHRSIYLEKLNHFHLEILTSMCHECLLHCFQSFNQAKSCVLTLPVRQFKHLNRLRNLKSLTLSLYERHPVNVWLENPNENDGPYSFRLGGSEQFQMPKVLKLHILGNSDKDLSYHDIFWCVEKFPNLIHLKIEKRTHFPSQDDLDGYEFFTRKLCKFEFSFVGKYSSIGLSVIGNICCDELRFHWLTRLFRNSKRLTTCIFGCDHGKWQINRSDCVSLMEPYSSEPIPSTSAKDLIYKMKSEIIKEKGIDFLRNFNIEVEAKLEPNGPIRQYLQKLCRIM